MNEITQNTPLPSPDPQVPPAADAQSSAADVAATPPAPGPGPSADAPTTVLPGATVPGPSAAPTPPPASAATGWPSGEQPTAAYAPGGYPGYGAYPPPSGGPGYAGPGYASGYAGAPSGTTYAPPPAYPPPAYAPAGYPPPTPPRRLLRSRSDRWLGGVCGGLARYWNTDPTLLRILTIVLTLATGGAFLIGYLIAWIAIPDEGVAPYGPGQPGGEQLGYAAGGNPPYADQAGYPTPPPAPRERSYLGWLVVSIVLVIAGALGLLAALLPSGPSVPGIIGGVALAVLGLGLVVGTWYGRARWLTLLAIPLALVTFAAVAAGAFVQSNPNWDRWIVTESDGQLDIGDRTWVVTPQDRASSPLDYRVSAGAAVLDLTALTNLGSEVAGDAGQRIEIDASVGAGELTVLVPDDMQLDLTGSVDLGEITLPGEPVRSGSNLDVTTTLEPVAEGQPAYIVTLDAAIGVGSLEVTK